MRSGYVTEKLARRGKIPGMSNVEARRRATEANCYEMISKKNTGGPI
jgi:hypothetical protein